MATESAVDVVGGSSLLVGNGKGPSMSLFETMKRKVAVLLAPLALLAFLAFPKVSHAGAGLGIPDLGPVGNFILFAAAIAGVGYTVFVIIAVPSVTIYFTTRWLKQSSLPAAFLSHPIARWAFSLVPTTLWIILVALETDFFSASTMNEIRPWAVFAAGIVILLVLPQITVTLILKVINRE